MDIYAIIRILHIIVGSCALLAGPIAMFNQNGGKLHRTAGNIYFWSMMFIVVSSIYMSIVKANEFLLMIGLFTFYLTATGVRALKLKKLHLGQKAMMIDWAILVITAISGLALFAWGCYVIFIMKNNFGIVAIVFSYVMIRGVLRDYNRFTVPPKEKNHWLFVHIGNMIGAYIATFTAFLVNNVHFEPEFIVWLTPTVLFLPIMIYSFRKFRGKTKKQEPIVFERGTY